MKESGGSGGARDISVQYIFRKTQKGEEENYGKLRE